MDEEINTSKLNRVKAVQDNTHSRPSTPPGRRGCEAGRQQHLSPGLQLGGTCAGVRLFFLVIRNTSAMGMLTD